MSEIPGPGLSNDLRELRELRRSRSNRVVAGVLGGVAGRLGVDPLLLRIVTVVLALFGGVGIVLYALGWLLIPDEDADASIGEQALGRGADRSPDLATVGLAAGLVVAALIATGGMFGSGTGWLLLILTVVGGVLLLRRQDGDADGEPQYSPGVDYPGFPGYVARADPPEEASPGTPSDLPGGTPADTPAGPPGMPQAGTQADGEDQATATAGPPASIPAESGAPAQSVDVPPAALTGTGWPEGPDWSPPLPDEYLEPAEARPADSAAQRSWLGPATLSAVALALGALAINDATWATIPVSAYVATALAIVGAGLLVGTWFGRARGLIALGILLALALPVSVVADGLNLQSVGSVTVRPESVEALPSGLQEYGVGSVVYDLSLLELADSDSITLDIEQGVGELRIVVPEDADVTVNADVGLGGIEAFNAWSGGPGSSRQITDLGDDGAGGGEITLNVELGVGKLEVNR